MNLGIVSGRSPFSRSRSARTMRRIACLRNAVLAGVLCLLTACSTVRVMMPTPNLYLQEFDPYADLVPALKSTEVPLFYVTDRAPERDAEGNLRYGYARSESLAFGTTVVDLGAELTWEDLLEASRTQRRLKPVELRLRDVTEIARGPATPIAYREVDGRIVEEPGQVVERAETAEVFRRTLVRQLALTPRKDVLLYIHGYDNTFDDAAFAMAELWHFLGRIGVPIVYTWPAGYPGLFGYTYDRESSEFTIYHLRQLLKFIASFPEVENVHLIAHSRGTDVALGAVRELTIAARAAGENPREKYKIRNLVLAAPDLDTQVARQRIMGDQLVWSADRFTIYTSPQDKAIGIASRFFASPRGRLGTLGIEQVDETLKTAMAYGIESGRTNFAIVNFTGATDAADSAGDRYGHSYFRDAPTVSSDLVLMLRDDLDPGTPGRPLEPVGLRFWRVPPGYPFVRQAQ